MSASVLGLFNKSSVQVFDTPGSGTWTVPDGVYVLTVLACGGGQGGLAVSGSTLGGNGAEFGTIVMQVTPGQVIPYAVGAGGLGESRAPNSGILVNRQPGGNTTFGTFTWFGGGRGEQGSRVGSFFAPGSEFAGNPPSSTIYAPGGINTVSGGGGGASLGRGGNGNNGAPYTGEAGELGGGGGSTNFVSGSTATGGRGGDGIIVISY